MSNRPLNRVERLQYIEQLLLRRPNGMRVVEIARACAVDRRTIYRDLIALEEAGVPLLQEAGRYRIIREQYEMGLRLAFHELMTVWWALQIYTLQHDRITGHVLTLAEKLVAAFAEPLAGAVAEWLAGLDTDFAAQGNAVVDVLALAWLRQRQVRLWIGQSENRTETYDLTIVRLAAVASGSLSLVGWNQAASQTQTIAVKQIRKAQLLDAVAVLPAQLAAVARPAVSREVGGVGSRTSVVLLFAAEAAPTIQAKQWFPQQEISALPDGGCRFVTVVDDWREIKSWVQSWGAQVRVLAPRVLREELVREAARLLAVYQENEDAVRVG